jgi:hypothetical protein
VHARIIKARLAFRLVVTAGFLVMLAVNAPGHLSFDSVLALHQGRTGVRETWAPAAVSWILGRFDAVLPGTGLYLAASGALLYLSLVSLAELRPRVSWWAPIVALAAVFTPQLLIYQGIVWKDVLFANLAVAGFIWLAHASNGGRPRQAAPVIAGAMLCFALAALVRQNGVLTSVFAAIALAASLRGRAWPVRAATGVGAFVAMVALALLIDGAVQPSRSLPGLRPGLGLRVLQHYDLIGAVARDPGMSLDAVAAVNPVGAKVIHHDARAYYSAQRVDLLDSAPALGRALWKTPDAAMAEQWRDVILHDPTTYLEHRAGVMLWLLGSPDLRKCLPVHTGVAGPADMLADLGMSPRVTPADRALAAYATRFYGTPVYSHLAYLALAFVVALLALRRGGPADVVMACLMGAAIAFTASFFFISIACDYRYLYFLDLAAITGALYLALDPPFGGRRRLIDPPGSAA